MRGAISTLFKRNCPSKIKSWSDEKSHPKFNCLFILCTTEFKWLKLLKYFNALSEIISLLSILFY